MTEKIFLSNYNMNISCKITSLSKTQYTVRKSYMMKSDDKVIIRLVEEDEYRVTSSQNAPVFNVRI